MRSVNLSGRNILVVNVQQFGNGCYSAARMREFDYG